MEISTTVIRKLSLSISTSLE
uniref:Uncharacterized protein n=1 Tax=Anguilla anguilla TaxID=7936 RepID=A0A0E9R441_ANGAN